MRTTPDAAVPYRADRLQHAFGLADAERGGGLVEDEDAGAAVHCARDGDGLTLAAGQGGHGRSAS
jgi:hypothetical protein